jgi:hypothetical protein
MTTRDVKRIAGVVVSTTALFSVSAVAPASSLNNAQGFGVQETLKDYYNLGDFSSESVTPSGISSPVAMPSPTPLQAGSTRPT